MNGGDAQNRGLRIGIDLGGTKIAGVCLGHDGNVGAEFRMQTPRGDYEGTIEAIADMVDILQTRAGGTACVGIGMPGSISPSTGRVQNANSTWLNDRPFQADISARLGRAVRCANDANCFVLSEALDGSAAGAHSVFGVILGTGCGGALVLNGQLVNGHRNIGGEWGHNPLPWPRIDETPGPACWCGLEGCLEAWVSGPALQADHQRLTGTTLTSEAIAAAARQGDEAAEATLVRHAGRLARGLACVVNVFDPAVIVLGGGLSERRDLYDRLPGLMAPYIFSADRSVTLLPPKWGAASGVRGAARLWDDER